MGKIKLDQDEVNDVIEDIKYDIESVERVLGMLSSSIYMTYRNTEPDGVAKLSRDVAKQIANFCFRLVSMVREADEVKSEIIAMMDEEENDPDASPYGGMSESEYKEEMYYQAADYFYGLSKDK